MITHLKTILLLIENLIYIYESSRIPGRRSMLPGPWGYKNVCVSDLKSALAWAKRLDTGMMIHKAMLCAKRGGAEPFQDRNEVSLNCHA